MVNVPTHRSVNGVEIPLTQTEIDAILLEWTNNQTEQNARQVLIDALNAQIDSDKTSLPTRTQVMTVIDNIANLADAKVFLKRLSNVVYTLRKNSVT